MISVVFSHKSGGPHDDLQRCSDVCAAAARMLQHRFNASSDSR